MDDPDRAKYWDETFAPDLVNEPRDVVVLDTNYLPRRMKKAWKKFHEGRPLTQRERRTVEILTSGRRSRIRYLRYAL